MVVDAIITVSAIKERHCDRAAYFSLDLDFAAGVDLGSWEIRGLAQREERCMRKVLAFFWFCFFFIADTENTYQLYTDKRQRCCPGGSTNRCVASAEKRKYKTKKGVKTDRKHYIQIKIILQCM